MAAPGEHGLPVPADVAGVIAAYAAAVRAADVDALMALYADDVRVFDTWQRWQYLGAPAWRTAVEEWFGSLGEDVVVATFEEVRAESDDATAWVSAAVRYAAVAPSGDELRSMHNRLTWVLRSGPDGWRVVHEHTSAPADGHDGRVILNRPPEG